VAGLDGGLFPVILVVFLLRSFLFEPFKIPSGSMIPTLLVGDLILVNKFTYGVRLPVITPRSPKATRPAARRRDGVSLSAQPSLDYIKRVVGVPGDEVAYLNKRLTINGKPVPTDRVAGVLRRRRDALFQAVRRSLSDKPHRC
jgi:signal peptidase I